LTTSRLLAWLIFALALYLIAFRYVLRLGGETLFWLLAATLLVAYGEILRRSRWLEWQPRRVRYVNAYLIATLLAVFSIWGILVYGVNVAGWQK
jgi:hypothetical protein